MMSKAIVIIPTYNEIENVPIVLDKLLNLSVRFDVLFVDDNSPDRTAELVKNYIKKNPPPCRMYSERISSPW